MQDPFFKQRGHIRTVFINPPVGSRVNDWSAYRPNSYDGAPDAGPIAHLEGLGATEEEAVRDLIEQESEYFEPDAVEPDESASIR